MSYNIGYFMALKTSATGGGVLGIEHIEGSDQSAQRGLHRPGHGQLPIFSPHSPRSALHYPVSTKFSASGVAIIQFLYDFSAIPHTVSSPGGILATPCRYSIKAVPGHNISGARGLLLNFSNITNFSQASPHFMTPSVPIPSVQRIIDDATTMARRLSAIANPLSRHVMAGMIIL